MEGLPILLVGLAGLVVVLPGLAIAARKNRRSPGSGEKTNVLMARIMAGVFFAILLYALIMMVVQGPREPEPEPETVSIALEDLRERLPDFQAKEMKPWND